MCALQTPRRKTEPGVFLWNYLAVFIYKCLGSACVEKGVLDVEHLFD